MRCTFGLTHAFAACAMLWLCGCGKEQEQPQPKPPAAAAPRPVKPAAPAKQEAWKPVAPEPKKEAEKPAPPPVTYEPGLNYAYYHGHWDLLPDFTTVHAEKTGVIANFDLSPRTRDTDFAFFFSGCIDVPVDGKYKFQCTSDDGARLSIDGKEVAGIDGLHPPQEEESYLVELKAGKHEIVLKFMQGAAGFALEVTWEGPNMAKQRIPDSCLSHRKEGAAAAKPPAPAGDAGKKD
jgi:hypothetical protein